MHSLLTAAQPLQRPEPGPLMLHVEITPGRLKRFGKPLIADGIAQLILMPRSLNSC